LELELSDDLFGFLAAVAQFSPAACPVDRLVKLCGKGRFTVEAVGVLTEYWAVSAASIQSVTKTVIAELFFQSLTLVNLETPPHPLSAVRCVIESEGRVSAEQMAGILRVVGDLFESEFEGQPCYWNVIGAAVSLMLSVLRVVGGAVVGVQELMPRLLAVIPRCLSKAEAGNVIGTLMLFQREEILMEYKGELIRIYTAVLAMRVRKLKELGIGMDVVGAVARMLAEAAAGDEVVLGRMAGEIGLNGSERLRARITDAHRT
jgi:hypothetical protein